mmetsp:Transcript_100673/g.259962  ORF Transcript_100673/g.259962 Transcript_100673/m.259962 type:complete len:1419 (-) Transcript_100673:242-4498(-)
MISAPAAASGPASRPPVRPTRRFSHELDLAEPEDPLRRSSTPRNEAPDDLLQLEDFNDSDLLRALWTRYERKEIYTWVGSVLVSVNPYKDIGAFREEVAARYASSSTLQAPHLFATVKAALAAPGNRHALLITGESGAGKTEATRAVLSFLAMRHTATDYIRDRLLRSTPVLEAFGNAHTRQNTNSSRFGKFIEVHLSAESEVVGATLQPYMLEASRVSGDLPQGERTYHVFYLLRAALNALANSAAPPGVFWTRVANSSEWAELVDIAAAPLASSSRLNNGPLESRCVAGFEGLAEGLIGTGMKNIEVAECCRVVAAVALLAECPGASADDASLRAAASLLRVTEADLRTFLTKAEMSVGAARSEKVFRGRTEREAATLRASLAQELYAALFGWLTKLVARGIAPPKKTSGSGKMLGLLDLYGFEVFPSNGFEQFLINYCNERLQQFFNRQVFTCEAEEYAAEGLDSDGQWSAVMTACTLPALALLQGEPGKGLGLFGVINDRSRCGFEDNGDKNTGTALADTIAGSCTGHPAFRRGAGRDASRVFGVKHFAGEVFYEAALFVRKNASAHRPDIVSFLREKGSSFVREFLESDEQKTEGLSAAGDTSKPIGSPAAGTPSTDKAGRPRRKLFGRTLISVFQQELNELCSALEARSCRHVRCLRPNDDQAPLVFDDGSMLRQCRYSGLLEATRIRRQGYAHRRVLRGFAARYALLLNSREARRVARHVAVSDAAAACTAICQAATSDEILPEDVRIGRTKVFLREPALTWFENARVSVASGVIIGLLRGIRVRRQFQEQRRSALRIQTNARGFLARTGYRLLLAELRAEEERLAAEAATAYVLRVEASALLLQHWWRNWMVTERARLEAVRAKQELELALGEQRIREQAAYEQHLREKDEAAQALARMLQQVEQQEALQARKLREMEQEEDVLTHVTDNLIATDLSAGADGLAASGASAVLTREALQQVPSPSRARSSTRQSSALKSTATALPIATRSVVSTVRTTTHTVATAMPAEASPSMASRLLAASPAAAAPVAHLAGTPRALHRQFQQECANLIQQQQILRQHLAAERIDLGDLGQAVDFRCASPPPRSVAHRPASVVTATRGLSGESVFCDNHSLRHGSIKRATTPVTISSVAVPSATYSFRGETTPYRGQEQQLVRSLSARSVFRALSPRLDQFRSPLRTTPAFPVTSYSFTPRSQSCCPAVTKQYAANPYVEEPITARRTTPIATTWRRQPSPAMYMPLTTTTVISTASPSPSTAATLAMASVAVPSATLPQWAWQSSPAKATSTVAAPGTPKTVSTKVMGPPVVLRGIPTPSRSRARVQSPVKASRATPAPVPATSVSMSPASVSIPARVLASPSPSTPSVAPPQSRLLSAVPLTADWSSSFVPSSPSPASGLKAGGAGSRCASPMVLRT